MAKGLNQVQVGLTFTADTGQAKAQVQELKNSISALQKSTISNAVKMPITQQVSEALDATSRLKVALEQATNVDTGRLDLSKFSQQLKKSGMDLKSYSQHLMNLGPDGEKAFMQLAQSIVSAERPMRRANQALTEMWTTMKNTARWQLSSSILHGFIGAVQEAFGYVQDLNESLNDIRIVTGYSEDSMAKFAKQANKAAKALSTTTNEYAKASLIYYQQGLSGDQVKERTDITIKMANVTKQSVDVVSDQMTAIWNNFYDGSKSLEYYADVMAKLGAATASSSDEIAEGLDKFVAIGETVGLSFEYATSALATVTAETRQSADVVGTAFKTLFARIEGLKLGETLEDGTDLNKYSAALSVVGVNIKNASGELKSMDTILDELGARWQSLAQDEKVALAQTVAGIRQYTQLISLMDNWDVFKENLAMSKTSEGELAAQAEIYAQSWNAASKRVEASLEDIYSKLIDDKFFIKLTDLVSKLVDGFGHLIESMGGLPGLLAIIGGIAFRVFRVQMADSIDRAVYNIKQSFGIIRAQTDQLKTQVLEALKTMGTSSGYESKNLEILHMKERIEWTDKLRLLSEQISTEDQEHIKNLIEMNNLAQDQLRTTLSLKEAKEDSVIATSAKLGNIINDATTKSSEYQDASNTEKVRQLREATNTSRELTAWSRNAGTVDANLEQLESKEFSSDMYGTITKKEDGSYSSSLLEETKALGRETYGLTETDFADIQRRINRLGSIIEKIQELEGKSERGETLTSSEQKELDSSRVSARGILSKDYAEYTVSSDSRQGKRTKTFDEKARTSGVTDEKDIKKVREALQGMAKDTKEITILENKSGKERKNLNKMNKDLSKSFTKISKATQSYGQKVVNVAQGISGLTLGLTSLVGAFESLSDPDLSPLEKISQFAMSATMLLPSVISGLSGLTGGFSKLTGAMGGQISIAQRFTDLLAHENAETSENITKKFLKLQLEEELNEETAKLVAAKLLESEAFDELNDEQQEALITEGAALLLEKQKNQEDVKGIGNLLLKIPLKKTEDAVEKGGIPGKLASIAANMGLAASEWMVSVPMLLIVGILALLLVGLLAVTAVVAIASAQFEKQAKAEYEQANANQELIDSNQELSESVKDLTDEYESLKAAGESTYDVIEKLKEQVPDLIDSYKELEQSLGIDLDTELLESAAALAELTGDWEEFIRLKEEADKKVEEEEENVNESAARSSGQLMAVAGKTKSGYVNGSNYINNLGGVGFDEAGANQTLKDAFDKKGISYTGGNNETKATVDLTNPTEMVNYYEALIEARNELQKSGDIDTGTYKEITAEIEEMAEAYTTAKEEADAYLDSVAKSFEEQAKSEYDDIKSLAAYESRKQEMIDNLVTTQKITAEEAKAIVEASDAFKNLEVASTSMEKFATDSGIARDELAGIYDQLAEEDRTLFLSLDFTDYRGLEDALQTILNDILTLKEQAKINEIKVEAKDLGFDESAFEAYTEILADTNENLDENSALTAQIALNNARLSKGLSTLASKWSDISSVLNEANRDTYEYAEAIGSIKDAMEEAFGYKPTTKFIENNLNKIRELANGNVEVLDELQDQLAIDYVMTMEVATSINSDGLSTDEVRNELKTILDGIDTAIELGEGTTISDTYMDSLQSMLDNAQITEEQLRKALRMKGIEMEVTGYKKVKGPSQTIVQKIDGPGPLDYTKTITEDTWIEVPIINGDASGIDDAASVNKDTQAYLSSGDIGKANFVKGTDDSTINVDALKEESGAKENEEKIKELKKEEDRYHSIERRIGSLQKKYDDLGKAKDRAFGGKKLALIEQEKKMLEQELLLQQQLLEEANNYYQKDRQALANEFGASFYTNSGEVANYEEMRQREQQYLENAYRSGDDNVIEQAEKRWEAFQEAMANYEQSLDKQIEAENRAVEIQNEIYDKHLEGLSYELEIKLMINDDELEYLEYLLSKIEDDAFKAAEKIANLSEQTEVLIEKGENYQQTIDGILNKHGVTMEQISSMSADQLLALGFTEAEIEKLRECKSGLLEVNQALLENKEAVEESLMPVYEAWGEEFDKISEKIEHASSVLEHYQNIIDLVGKKRLGMTNQDLIKLSEGQVKVAENNLQVAQNRYQAAVSSRNEAEEKLAAAKARAAADPENEELQKDVKYWEGIFNDLDADVRAQEQNRNAMLEAALEAAAEKYRLITESILEDFEKGLSAVGKDLETLSKSYERSSEIDDRYIENYEKMYELNKLSRSLEEKLSKSNSLAEQKAIRQQLEKINSYKAENVKMSEHDLEVLQKQVEVEQARIAMEEAQNAKTQVIRRRDENGNWGYVYTADTEKSNELAQEYENKIYELMKLNDKYLDDLGEKIIQAQIEMRDALAELNEEDFASREEYMAKVNEITEYYNGMINYYYDELNKSIGYNTDIYAYDLQVRTDWSAQSVGISQDQLIALSEIRREDYDSTDAYYTAIEERTGLDRAIIKQLDEAGTLSHIEEVAKQIGANNDLQLSFSDTRYAQTTEYETMEQAQEDFTSATQTMVDNLNNAYVQHTADVEHELNLVGLSLTDTESEYTAFRDHVETQISGEGGVVDQSEAAADSTDQMYKDMEEDFGFAADAVEGWQKIYSDEIDKVIKKNDDLWDNLEKLIRKLAEAEKAEKDYNEGRTTGSNGGNSPSGNDKGQDTSTNYTTDNYDKPSNTPTTVVDPYSKYLKLTNENFHMEYDLMEGGYERASTPVYDGSNWKNTKVYGYDGSTRFILAEYTANLPGRKGTKWWIPYDKFLKNNVEQDHVQSTTYALARSKDKDKKLPSKYYKQSELPKGFDTGGYTGSWGAEGRMAMLHQKELVLNAQDTENFLLATNILRDIVSKIELASLSSMLNTNIISQGLTQNLGNNFEQNVVIHAEFPDATNHSEIEEAFNNLLNRASQFANRK